MSVILETVSSLVYTDAPLLLAASCESQQWHSLRRAEPLVLDRVD